MMDPYFDCPTCKQQARKLIIPPEGKQIVCGNCYHKEGSPYNWQLHDVVFDDGKTRLTRGKAWEIDNRVKSKDDKRTIINKVTGKPAQY